MMGVASKWYSPSIAVHADSSGFCLHFLTMLTRKLISCASLHKSASGKFGGTKAGIDLPYDLYVCSPASAGLVRCMSGGVYCNFAFCVAMKSSTSFDVLLLSLCRRSL